MSTQTKDQPPADESMGTKPQKEHEWLSKLVGEWNAEADMCMPDGSKSTSKGTESVKSLSGLFSYHHAKLAMPGGPSIEVYVALGYDVTFNEYRKVDVMSVSSHIWNYKGQLSSDGKRLTLDCEGPNMNGEGTAQYRDVIEVQEDNHRTLTSYWQLENGQFEEMMKVRYVRA